MNHTRDRDRRLAGDRCGIAAIEFALVSPLAIVLMLATADVGSFIRLRLNLDSTASTLAGAISQYSQLYAGDFTGVFAAAQTIAGSTQISGASGCTVITGVVNSGSGPLVAWQQISPSSMTCASSFGKVNTVPVLPDGYALPANSTLITVEVLAKGTPWVLSTAYMGHSSSTVQRGIAMFQTRTAMLVSITPGNRP